MDIAGRVETVRQLEGLYQSPSDRAANKSFTEIDDATARFIEHCPFVVLATADGNGSVDASPRGGPPGFVRCLDDRHVAVPDLNGNNRLDSYRNIVEHGWAGLLMMVPGKDETIRINGPAVLTTDAELLAGFTKELRPPKLAVIIETAEIFGHCAKAFRRAKMWDPSSWEALAGAPDLAELYACAWGIDEKRMRAELAGVYHDDLSRD